MDVTRVDQALSLPKGVQLVGVSGIRCARKVSSNVSDGMEWWSITSFPDGTALNETSSPFDVEEKWLLI